MTTARTAPTLELPPPRRRWLGLLLATALVASPARPLAQDQLQALPQSPEAQQQPSPQPQGQAQPRAQDWPAGPESQGKQLTQPLPLQPDSGHRGLYWSLEIGLASATAGGAGATYSLTTLSGGGSSPTWNFDLRFGQTLRPDLRLGLAFGGLVAKGSSGGLESTASIGHVGGELSWHPRLDGPFLRGEVGLGWLQLYGSGSGPDAAGRDRTCLGPEVTVGGGYLLAFPGSGHLVGSVGLSWARYTDSGGLGGRLAWSLAWTGRVGIDFW
jgi:hypothetical protein